jgi:hypothetical protein
MSEELQAEVQDIDGLLPQQTLLPATTNKDAVAFDPDTEEHANMVVRGAKESVGLEPSGSYRDPTSNVELQTKLEDMELDTVKEAMRLVAYDMRRSPEERAEAMKLIAAAVDTQNAGYSRLADVERSVSLATRANEERLAYNEQMLSRKVGLIEDKARTGGRMEFEAYQEVKDTDHLLQYRDFEKRGDTRGMATAAIAYADERWKLFSTDTAAMFTPVGTLEVTRGKEMVNYLQDPEIKKIADKWSAAGAQLSYGQFKEDIAETIKKLPKDRQIKVMNRLVSYLKMQYTTGQDGNALVELGMVNSLLERIADPNFEEGAKYTTFKVLDTLGGILDATVIGGVVGRTLKLSGRLAKGSLRTVRVAPNHVAKELAQAAIEDPTLLPRLGVKSVDDLGELAFGSFADTIKGSNVSVDIAPAVREASARILNAREFIRKALSNKPVTLSTEQLRAGMTTRFNRIGMMPLTDLTTFAVKGDAISVAGRFGRGANEGFETASEARAAVAELTDGKVMADVSVRHMKSGTIVTPDDPNFIKVTEDAAYNPEQYEFFADIKYDTTFDEVMNADDFIESTYVGQKLGFVEKALFSGKRFSRVASALWDNKTNAAAMFAAGNKKHVQELLNSMIKPETDVLTSAGRAQLNKALVANNGVDEVFSTGRLVELGVTDKNAQKAYYAYRNAFDVAHEIADTGLARSMRSQNYRQILSESDKVLGYGVKVPLADIPRNKTISIRQLDDGVDVVKEVNLADLSRMMDEEGATLFRMRESEWVGKSEIAYTLVSSKRAGKSVRQVPAFGVLNKAKGYFPEMVKGNLAVYGMTPSGRRFLVGTADTTADAQKLKQSLLEEYASLSGDAKEAHVLSKLDGGTVDVDMFRGYKEAIASGKSEGVYENLNGAVYGHKGPWEVMNASGDAADANWLDPITATQAMFSLLANNYTKGAHITSMQKQVTHFAKQNKLLGEGYQGGDVVSVEQLIDGAKLTGKNRELYENAVKRLETIEAYRLLPDEVDVFVSDAMKNAANVFADKLPWLEGKLLARSQQGNDPFAFMNRLFHFTNIVTNPVRQFMMNRAQALTNLAHPMGFAAALRQRGAFQNALFLRQDNVMRSIPTEEVERAMNGYAKWMGVSRKELDGMLDTYLEGGLWNQVTHNTAARASARSELEAKVLRDISKTAPDGSIAETMSMKVQDMFGNTTQLMNDVGFALGEHENTMDTFLTLFNTHRKDKAFDVSTQAGKEMLTGKTLTWIGNMTPEGRAGFQTGWLKTMFQYAAFPYKMALLMLPETLGGSKFLTKTEKASIVLTQTMMWGSDATKFGETIRHWFEDYYLYDEDATPQERADRVAEYKQLGLDKFFKLGVAGQYMNSLLTQVHNAAITDLDEWDSQKDATAFGAIMSAGGGLDLIAERARALAEILPRVMDNDKGEAMKAALELAGGTNGRKLVDWSEYAGRWGQLLGIGETLSMEPDEETFKWLAKDGFSKVAGFYDKNLAIAAARHYGYWMGKSGTIVRPYEDNLRNFIAAQMGAPSITEEAYYDLLKTQDLSNTLKKGDADKAADKIVKELMSRIRVLPMEGERANSIHDAFLLEHDKRMNSYYRSLPPAISKQVQEAVRAKLDGLAKSDTAEARALKRVLGEVVTMGHTGKDIKKVLEWQSNALVQSNPRVSEALYRFATEHEKMKRAYEED